VALKPDDPFSSPDILLPHLGHDFDPSAALARAQATMTVEFPLLQTSGLQRCAGAKVGNVLLAARPIDCTCVESRCGAVG
jgi:hypothetical protein